MKIIWLGQNGFLFETNDGMRIMIDPYLSNSCGEKNPKSFRRLVLDERFEKMKPDILIFTHNHLDHYDPQTVRKIIHENSNITVLCPTSVWNEVRLLGGSNNYVQFNRHTQWSVGDVVFQAVAAAHSDPYAIGLLISAEKMTLYLSGDTLYNSDIFADIPKKVTMAFLPVNGRGNNMNFHDAVKFAEKIEAQDAVAVHFGMLDDLTATDFPQGRMLFFTPYREYRLSSTGSI